MASDAEQYDSLLHEAQRLRGKIYLKDGAIRRDQLSRDGRHIQAADDTSWHLLTVDQDRRVTACIRYTAHPEDVCFEDLHVVSVLEDQPACFAVRAERSIRGELAKAKRLGFTYVELGGWVVEEDLRCSTEAIRMLLMMYSLSQLMGGAIALSTATTRHSSSSILRRIGGKSLVDNGEEIPPYFDSHYDCDMEMVCFDSRSPNPRYSGWIREFRDALLHIPMFTPAPVHAVASAGETFATMVA